MNHTSRVLGVVTIASLVPMLITALCGLALQDIFHRETDVSFEWAAVRVCLVVTLASQAVIALLSLRLRSGALALPADQGGPASRATR